MSDTEDSREITAVDNVESCAWLGDARSLPWGDESVDCIVTSPPYWGQRDSGTTARVARSLGRIGWSLDLREWAS